MKKRIREIAVALVELTGVGRNLWFMKKHRRHIGAKKAAVTRRENKKKIQPELPLNGG